MNSERKGTDHHYTGRLKEDGEIRLTATGTLDDSKADVVTMQGKFLDKQGAEIGDFTVNIDHDGTDNFDGKMEFQLQEKDMPKMIGDASASSKTDETTRTITASVKIMNGTAEFLNTSLGLKVPYTEEEVELGLASSDDPVATTTTVVKAAAAPPAATPPPAPTATEAPVEEVVRHVQTTVVEMKLEPEDFGEFDEAAARAKLAAEMAKVNDNPEADVKVKVTFEYAVKAQWEFTNDLTSEQIRSALAAQYGVPEEKIEVVVLDSRRLAGTSRMLQSGSVKAEGTIKTAEKSVAQNLETGMSDPAKLASAISEVTGTEVAPPVVTAKPKAAVNIQTQVERTVETPVSATSGDATKAGAAAAVATPAPIDISSIDMSAMSKDMGGTMAVTKVDTSTETRTVLPTTTAKANVAKTTTTAPAEKTPASTAKTTQAPTARPAQPTQAAPEVETQPVAAQEEPVSKAPTMGYAGGFLWLLALLKEL